MADLSLRDDLVERLNNIAHRENRRIDEVMETLLNRYDPWAVGQMEQDEAVRQDTLHLYERARRYWQSVADPRQYMENDELDQQFWLIDQDGIPRLKADQPSIVLPVDALVQMLDIAEADQSLGWQRQESGNSKKLLNSDYTDYLISRLDRPAVTDE